MGGGTSTVRGEGRHSKLPIPESKPTSGSGGDGGGGMGGGDEGTGHAC